MTRLNGSGPEKVIIAGLIVRDVSPSLAEEHLQELSKLVESAGGSIAGRVLARRPNYDPATWVGKGKAAEIAELAKTTGAKLVVFDDDLSPAQIRNLETIINSKVIDRSALILDIFARRARTREAKTQVELAQLQYLLPRLTRHWSHLSRQAGGIGTRGVGETQLEIDRRIIRTRISRLREDLGRIERNRETQRKKRRSVFSVALVGYTNAGKSTLFNQLTAEHADAADKLFATLDSKVQKIRYPMPAETVVIDTVGFIRKLPHHLVASFRSTMEEAVSADLVVHLIDGSHPQADDQREIGRQVLEDLGIPADHILEVYNKSDRLEGLRNGNGQPLTVSALTGEGCDRLVVEIRHREHAAGEVVLLELNAQDSRGLAEIHELAEVLEETSFDHTVRVVAWVPNDSAHRLERYAAGSASAQAQVSHE